MTIYADELFAVNFISDFLLIYAYAVICGIKKRKRMIDIAAAAGGLYAVIEAVFGFSIVLRAVLPFIMAFISFGRHKALYNAAGLVLFSICIEGVTIAALSFFGAGAEFASGKVTLFTSGITAAFVYIASYPIIIAARHFFKRGGRYRTVEIYYNGREIKFRALYDSGNLLKYRGMPVVIADWHTAAGLFSAESYAELITSAPDVVSYSTISKSGIMPVFVPDICRIDGKQCSAAAAVSEKRFSGGYGGIAGNI